ncbi:helix-turn-helix domain-containing protein [Burkholderia glumae]
MGRKSVLTPAQWHEIEQRLVAGEGFRALAREFGISDAAIRQRLSTRVETVKAVAGKLAKAQTELRTLPIASQMAAQTLAEKLMSVSRHLAGAAEYGAATAHRLAGVAHAKAQEIDDAEPLTPEGIETLRGIAALTKTANEAGAIGIDLLRANKEAVDDMGKREAEKSRLENYTDDQLNAHIAELNTAIGG